jgi:DNA polymerase
VTKRLWVDTETRSSVPIRDGTRKYSTDVQIIMLQWAMDDGPVRVIDDPCHPRNILNIDDFVDAAREADEVWAHRAEFDRTVLNRQPWGIPPLGKCVIPLWKWRCTMAMARMHGLPGALDKLCTIFKIPQADAKDRRGKALIQLFCIPRKDGGYNDKHSHPVQWQEFLSYGPQDVVAMRAVWRQLPKWNATPLMWHRWHVDQRVNDRGICVDVELATAAINATEAAKRKLAKRTAEITHNVVDSTTQVARLKAYLEAEGVALPNLTADTVERRLEDESLSDSVKELLRVRQDASKASTAKYKRVVACAVDGRLHNLLEFCGAARTGRWSGRIFQPQNLPRPEHSQDLIEFFIDRVKAGDVEAIELVDGVLPLASSALRGLQIAAPAHKLVVADLANIEGRVMAWLAGEDWKLDAFRAYDAKRGPDLYKLAYARSFNIDPAGIGDADPRRQIGKVMELSLQYYGGVGAFCSMAETYGLRLEALAEAAWNVLPRDTRDQATVEYYKRHTGHNRKRTYGLDSKVWITCHALVLLWRRAHPNICKFWYALDNAVKAVMRGSESVRVKRVVVDRQENWLRIRLPSGRYLLYPAPRQTDDGTSFIGVDPYTKQWGRISTYCGKIAANITQASAADIFMDGMCASDDAGYRPVMLVHDELICEAPDSAEFTDKELSQLMVSSSIWADGLPLSAKGFTAQRYRK